MSKRCWFSHCWHDAGPALYDARSKRCTAPPDLRECRIRECCHCHVKQGVIEGWDGYDEVVKALTSAK